MTAPAGSVNAWKCDKCGGVLVAIHVVEGVTPMFLACRARPTPEIAEHAAKSSCDGRMISAGYPSPPVPAPLLEALAWEWRLPTMTERKRWRRENPAMLDHVTAGGLVLDRLSPDGLRQARTHHNYTPTGRPQ